ncbi:zinc finger protein PLAG1 [Salmo salar]|uniref:Zinc finger protein PLAG1 n=1 Tax=Salmo salar TaxID=8030 RepID=A0A1S3NCY9_SALSA|nr:zinc finger protein PLAG1 [Salmo salar]|eukprot:XP_014013338.1 PREDICTED: zinc finger protein PLAG1-like [Salmo salar]
MATGTQGHLDHISDKSRLAVATGRRKRAEGGKPRKNFPCQLCEKAFNSVEKLKVHSYSHTGERPYRCSHQDCTKAFVSKYKLLRHMVTHSPEKTHKCTYCEKMFQRKDHLKNHLHTHDPNKEAFTCQECSKSYNTKLGFKRHLALHAANSGDLTCQVCLQPFASTGLLLEHLKSHAGKASGGTKDKKHRCEHCERRFITRKDVRRHMVVHTGRKDFLCQYCAQRFGRKDHLTRHVKKSHARELLRVKTEPDDSLASPFSNGMAGGVKGELATMSVPRRQLQLNLYGGPLLPQHHCPTMPPLDIEPNPPHPFSLKYQLGSNLTSYSISTLEREQNLKGELETYLMELQSGMPSWAEGAQLSSASKLELDSQVGLLDETSPGDVSLSKIVAVGESLASSSLVDFSQLFNFLPLNGPPYGHQAAAGGGLGGLPYLPEEALSLVQLPPQPPDSHKVAGSGGGISPLLGHSSYSSNLSTTTTLPRFHQAFQ